MRTSSISSSSSLSVVVVVVVFLVGSLLSIVGQHKPGHAAAVSLQLQSLQMNSTISVDPESLDRASTDFGMLARAVPAAVLRPLSDRDIAALVEFTYSSARPFSIAARGHGHSVRGQALAADGVVVEMASLRGGGERIRVCRELGYVDAGGEELWIDVLEETVKHGLAPRSWTDYLYLTVGGTLSNAGLSGQSFLYGPQISNVYQLDVVTGTGQIVTCSEKQEPDLFFAVLGGLGQFGIITRARIAIEPAPAMVRWIRLIYADFRAFTSDQERLISLEEKEKKKGFNYVEGSVIMASNLTYNWRSSFYAQEDISRISRLAAQYGAVYCLEAAMYYDYSTAPSINQEVELLLKDLNFIPGFQFMNDVTYMHFLDRVREGELKLHSRGLWDVPHPWLNILVPSSRILDFDQGVFKTILIKHNNNSVGPILIYATNRSKWDQRMSAVVPDEQVFYSVGLLRSGTVDDWKYLEEQNKEILRFCDEAAISYKQYLPHYTNKADWMKHFGHKWDLFVERKMRYDPKSLLSPGQRIFVSSFAQHASM